MSSRQRLDTVKERLAGRGYDVSERGGDTVADPTSDTDPIGVPGPLSIVPATTDPTALLESIGSAASAGRTALLVAHPDDVTGIRRVLTDPPGLADRTETSRTFYGVPDRFPAGNEGFACCRADDPPVWRETTTEGVTGEGRRFLLFADDHPVTAFGTFDELSCPSADAFEYAYRRDDDGRFVVRRLASDRVVGRFPSVRELKANAYQPIPVPLVPETVVDGSLPEAWTIATVEGGRVTSIEGA